MSDEVPPVYRPSSVSITPGIRRVIGHDVRRERQIGAENALEQAMRPADELALLV